MVKTSGRPERANEPAALATDGSDPPAPVSEVRRMSLKPLDPIRKMNATPPKEDWWKWLFGQPAYIVLLFAILGAIAYGAWYGFPAAIDKIQAGYETLDKRHAAERKEMRDEAKQDRIEFREAIKENTRVLQNIADRIPK